MQHQLLCSALTYDPFCLLLYCTAPALSPLSFHFFSLSRAGVELIKLNAWEEAFAHRVEAVRGAELKKLGLAALVKSAASVLSRATPVYVTFTTFSLAGTFFVFLFIKKS